MRSIILVLFMSGCIGGASWKAGAGGGAGGTSGGAEQGAHGGPAGAMDSSGGGGGDSVPPTSEPKWDDFAFAVRERSGSYWQTWTITKLTTFQVGDACYAKLGDEESDALNNTAYHARSVRELAKKWTGDDWEQIENQRSDRARDRALIEPMIDEFGKRFHLTIAVEGDDCEVARGALWIRYWFAIAEAFADYPPSSGKLFVTLNVSKTARDVTSTVDDTGTKFTFTAPRDIEPSGWSDKLEKPFRKNAAKL